MHRHCQALSNHVDGYQDLSVARMLMELRFEMDLKLRAEIFP